MQRHPTTRSSAASFGSRLSRSGFTLVEMLVSVALLLLMMSLFAQAFGIAANSIRTQRGLAENDQRARSMVTIFLGDIQKRTYRQRDDAISETIVLPFDATPAERTVARIEDAANRLSLGMVPLHPDYYIGGGQRGPIDIATGQAPEAATDGAARRLVDSVRERGYFYYSEGDVSNDADDVLKFTVNVSQTDLGNTDTTKIIGRAMPLAATWDATGSNNQPANLDQPIWDDGIGYEVTTAGGYRGYVAGETGTTSSDVAEIAYFLRDGNLYRRVHLVRQSLGVVASSDQTAQPVHPSFVSTPGLYSFAGGFGGLHFWQDFDHGATRFEDTILGTTTLHMSDQASMDNTIGGDPTGGGGIYPLDAPHRFWALGDPRNRFGHDATFPPPGGLSGRPKEYMNPAVAGTFFGMYTHGETSHPHFRFPGQRTYNADGAGNGMWSPFRYGPLATIAASDLNGDGFVNLLDQFDSGPRAGEDILLGNCHAFDVKVWDDEQSQFVDVGHVLPAGTSRGDWHASHVGDNALPGNGVDEVGRYQAPFSSAGAYGSRSGGVLGNRVFDSWHPAFNFTNNTKPELLPPFDPVERPDDDPPPHRPLWSDRDDFFTSSGYTGGNPQTPGNPSAIRFWQAGTDYVFGDRVFPRPNLLGGALGNRMPTHQSFFYQAAEAVDGPDGDAVATSDPTNQPTWPEVPGATIEDGGSGDRIVWKAINNTIGLKAIQITVRFLDPTSGQLRQLTLTHSFVEL